MEHRFRNIPLSLFLRNVHQSKCAIICVCFRLRTQSKADTERLGEKQSTLTQTNEMKICLLNSNKKLHPFHNYLVFNFVSTLFSIVHWRFWPTLGLGPGPGPSVRRRGPTPGLGPWSGRRLRLAPSGCSRLGFGLRLRFGPRPGVGPRPRAAVAVAAPGPGSASAPRVTATPSAALSGAAGPAALKEEEEVLRPVVSMCCKHLRAKSTALALHLALAFTPDSTSSLPPAPTSVTSVPARRTRSSGVHGLRWSTVAGHLHPELPAVKERSVHGVHGVLGVSLIMEANEGEASALLSVPVPGDVNVPDAAVLIEHSAQGLRWGSVGEVVHFKRGHPLHVRRRPSVVHLLRLCDNTSVVEPNKTPTNKIPVVF